MSTDKKQAEPAKVLTADELNMLVDQKKQIDDLRRQRLELSKKIKQAGFDSKTYRKTAYRRKMILGGVLEVMLKNSDKDHMRLTDSDFDELVKKLEKLKFTF